MIPLVFLTVLVALYCFRKTAMRYFPFVHAMIVFFASGIPVLMAIPAFLRFPHPIPVLSFYIGFFLLVPTTFFSPSRFKKARLFISLYFHFLILTYWIYPLRAMLTLSPELTIFMLPAILAAQSMLFLKVPTLNFRMLTVVALFAFFSGARVASFVSTTGDHCDAITDNNAITPLFTYCDPDWQKTLRKFFPAMNPRSCQFRGARFAIPSQDLKFVYLGTGGCDKTDAFLKYDRRKHKIVKALAVKDAYSVHENMKPHLLFVSAHPSPYLYVVEPLTLKKLKTIRTPGDPLHVDSDEKLRKIFLDFEHDPAKLQVLNLDSFKAIKNMRVIDISTHYMIYSHAQKILYFVGRDGWKDYLIAIDAENYSELTIAIPSFAVGMALDEKRNFVFLAFPMKGLIGIYDAQNLAPIKFLKAGFGVRELAFDGQTQRLYAGNYITGKIKVFNADNGKAEKEFFAGMRIRRLFYSEKLKRLFVANANGFMEINPDKL